MTTQEEELGDFNCMDVVRDLSKDFNTLVDINQSYRKENIHLTRENKKLLIVNTKLHAQNDKLKDQNVKTNRRWIFFVLIVLIIVVIAFILHKKNEK